MSEQVKNKKRSLISTYLLIGQMLFTSPKKGTAEENFADVAGSIIDSEWNGWAIVEPHLEELVDQDYLAPDGQGGYRVTPYGQKMALQATHNTPDFDRLAGKGASVSFAMVFAGFEGLKTHLANQDRLVSGKSDELVQNTREMIEFFAGKLGLQVTEIPAPKPVKATKTKEVV